VLDAGCGTGRVAVELARRGLDVTGVDIDDEMLAEARAKAPDLPWVLGDLATVQLGCEFDLAVMAGNVMLFVEPDVQGKVVANVAAHLRPSGLLLAGFTLDERVPIREYDAMTERAGLSFVDRWATWDRRPFTAADSYAVSLHRAG
jgi:SAM-dependent methyltransferase